MNTLYYINNTFTHNPLCFYIKIELIHQQIKLRTQNPSTKNDWRRTTDEQRPTKNEKAPQAILESFRQIKH